MGATLALIVLAGLGGALVMASLASIRRAEAGWDALQADTPPADAVATVMTEDFQFPSPAVDDLAGLQADVDALPGVEQTMRLSTIVAEVSASGSEDPRLVAGGARHRPTARWDRGRSDRPGGPPGRPRPPR